MTRRNIPGADLIDFGAVFSYTIFAGSGITSVPGSLDAGQIITGDIGKLIYSLTITRGEEILKIELTHYFFLSSSSLFLHLLSFFAFTGVAPIDVASITGFGTVTNGYSKYFLYLLQLLLSSF